MAKLKDDVICKEDINEFLEKHSNFAFEVKVLKEICSLGFEAEQCGTYEDPITRRTREFDIRATKRLIDEGDFKLDISLSIECKNLKNSFPLLVHCMPRGPNENYIDIVWASNSKPHPAFDLKSEHSTRIPLTGIHSPYEVLGAVGKSTDQIGRRDTQNQEVIGNDGDVFEKISQAINSAYDLISFAHYSASKEIVVATVVIPVLVVPDDCIWSVWYKRDGSVEREPTLEPNIEYYIDKSWLVGDEKNEYQRRYYLSHLEIVQFNGIRDMLKKYTESEALKSSKNLKAIWLNILNERQ